LGKEEIQPKISNSQMYSQNCWYIIQFYLVIKFRPVTYFGQNICVWLRQTPLTTLYGKAVVLSNTNLGESAMQWHFFAAYEATVFC